MAHQYPDRGSGRGGRWMDQRALKLALRLKEAGLDDVEILDRLIGYHARQREREARRQRERDARNNEEAT